MKVADLGDRMKVEEIELDIVEKEEPREFTSRSGQSGRVCNATGQDDAGDSVKLTLWNDEVDQVEEGHRIRITNGWSKEYQGEIELSAGRYGTLEILD